MAVLLIAGGYGNGSPWAMADMLVNRPGTILWYQVLWLAWRRMSLRGGNQLRISPIHALDMTIRDRNRGVALG